MTGLVLTAGGARGAYQAGVIKRISEIPALRDGPSPFRIIAGASAGAINGAGLAASGSSFAEGAALLARLWSQLTFKDVFRTDARALARTGGKLALDMALGGLIGAGRVDALVDAAPLRRFLGGHLRFDGIAEAIAKGDLHAVAITATGYHSGKAFTFIQGQPGHAVWNKSRRVALPATLTLDHVLASSSIPLVFPPVALAAAGSTAYFGDGALRLTTPMSPAIRLGADRVFAIGVRCQEAADSLLRSELSADPDLVARLQRPPLSQICGVFLNAIFLDHLDADVDHLRRMNELVAAFHNAAHTHEAVQNSVSEPMRIVEPLIVSPSADLAIIAKTLAHRMPRAIRYVMDGLGTPDAQSADLTSYLLFDKAFTSELIQLGYRDAAQRVDEIEQFLVGARSQA
ncbi:MAG TPA: patatin-like phospholipase family protein [Sphingopyxis sp.]|nr:patatin-like phospholipase family protein [Sphingopyxis sp.]